MQAEIEDAKLNSRDALPSSLEAMPIYVTRIIITTELPSLLGGLMPVSYGTRLG